MPVGKIIDVPNIYSSYGRIQDEYGEIHTVHGSEVPIESKEQDDVAYHVDLWQNRSGNVVTLREGLFGPEE